MAKWKKVITDHHAWAHPPDQGYDLITQPPASQQQLDELASRLGITLPKELVSLYLTYNGFGVRSRDSSHTDWFLVPVQKVPQFTKQIRS
ncbi:MAG: SMI1/KNR4 family protein [Pirellulaceae bacterium]